MEKASDSVGATPSAQAESDDGVGVAAIKINVSYGTSLHEIHISAQSTFGDIKKMLVHKIGLEPEHQRVFFRGIEKDDKQNLQLEGVKDKSKILLLEGTASKERKLEETKKLNERKLEETKKLNEILKASEAITGIRVEVDKLSDRVTALEVSINARNNVSEKEFLVLTELLMSQLLKLDGVEAEGEAKLQRKAEVRRVQSLVDLLDSLKTRRNSIPFTHSDNAVTEAAPQWETFDTGTTEGSNDDLSTTTTSSSTKISQDWERFE